jgi:hypothetical protein
MPIVERAKTSEMKHKIKTFFRFYGLAFFWLLHVCWMVADFQKDPGKVSRHGYNTPQSLTWIVGISVVELIILYVFLNPWYRELMVFRLFLATGLMWGWVVINVLLTMHGGGVAIIHLLWLLSVAIVLPIAWIYEIDKRSKG